MKIQLPAPKHNRLPDGTDGRMDGRTRHGVTTWDKTHRPRHPSESSRQAPKHQSEGRRELASGALGEPGVALWDLFLFFLWVPEARLLLLVPRPPFRPGCAAERPNVSGGRGSGNQRLAMKLIIPSSKHAFITWLACSKHRCCTGLRGPIIYSFS